MFREDYEGFGQASRHLSTLQGKRVCGPGSVMRALDKLRGVRRTYVMILKKQRTAISSGSLGRFACHMGILLEIGNCFRFLGTVGTPCCVSCLWIELFFAKADGQFFRLWLRSLMHIEVGTFSKDNKNRKYQKRLPYAIRCWRCCNNSWRKFMPGITLTLA